MSIYAPENDYPRTSSLFELLPLAEVAVQPHKTTEQLKLGGQYIQNWILDLNLLVCTVTFVAGETFYGDELHARQSMESWLWERQTGIDRILFIWGVFFLQEF